MRKGFTLVELSIVLVIVGLIIGGILVAQSMKEATLINSQVRQIQQFDILMSQYSTRFGRLPGDANKDNVLGGDNLFKSDREFGNVWSDLSNVEMLSINNLKFSAPICNPCNLAVGTIPTSALEPKSGILAYGAGQKNYYSMVAFNTPTSLIIQGEAFIRNGVKPALAAALDSKMDDGVATTGIMVAREWQYKNVYDTGTDAANGGTGCLNGSSNYKTANSAVVCVPKVEMLAQTGGNN